MNTNSRALLVPPKTAGDTNAGKAADGLRDIKPPVVIPSGWAWLAWVLGGALLLALLVQALRRWRRHAAIPFPAFVSPPHVRARDRLRRALDAIHDARRFCTEVSDTLRSYLEERFELHAPDRTTEEFLDELQTSPLLSLAQKQALGEFLARCDLVKFARYEPGEPELRELWNAAMQLVDETAPSPEPTETAAV